MNFFSVACFTLLVGLVCASQLDMPQDPLSGLKVACKSRSMPDIQTLLAQYVAACPDGTELPIDIPCISQIVKKRSVELQNTLLEVFESDKKEAALRLGLIDAYMSLSGSSLEDVKALAIKTRNVAMSKALTLVHSAPFTITDLFKAVKDGNMELVEFILLASPTINEIMLKARIGSGHYHVVSYLESLRDTIGLSKGALQLNTGKILDDIIEYDLDIHSNNDRALRNNARMGRFEIVKYLVERGANIHADDDFAVIQCALNNYPDILNYLFQNGADICAKDNAALRLSVHYGYPEIVEYLVKNGANPHAVTESDLFNAKGTRYHDDIATFLKRWKRNHRSF